MERLGKAARALEQLPSIGPVTARHTAPPSPLRAIGRNVEDGLPMSRRTLGRVPLLLIGLALLALASQVSISLKFQPGLPLTTGLVALALAVLAVLAPAAKAFVVRLAAPEAAALPLGLLAYALSRMGVPPDALAVVFDVGVIGLSVAIPTSAGLPPCAAGVVAVGYMIGASRPGAQPWSNGAAYMLASVAATGLLMSLSVLRLRRADAARMREGARLSQESRRLELANASIKEASDVATA